VKEKRICYQTLPVNYTTPAAVAQRTQRSTELRKGKWKIVADILLKLEYAAIKVDPN